MDQPNISIVEPGFSLETSHQGGVLIARFTGNADMSTMKTLSSALKRMHDEALRLRVTTVICDFLSLYFMNSSCFKSFVGWITTVEDLEPKARYRIRMRSNQQLHWQKRSLEALRCLAEKVVTIE